MEIKIEPKVTDFRTREGGEEKALEKIARTIEGLPGVEPAPVTVADVRYLLERVQEVEDYSLRNYKSYQAEVDAGYRQSRRIAELVAENESLRQTIATMQGMSGQPVPTPATITVASAAQMEESEGL